MRKSKRQRKNETSRQLEIFTRHVGELTGSPAYGRGTGSLGRVELLSLLEKQRTLTENLLEKIVDYENLTSGYKHVNLSWFSRLRLQSIYLRITV